MRDFWRGRQVLVTGAGGFIGSHLVETLAGLGAQVRAFVHYNSRGDPGMLGQVPAKVLSGVEIIAGDLRDYDAVTTVARGMDTIFHLGALIAIPYSYQHSFEVVQTNVIGTLNVLLAARSAGVERVVHTSTSEVYGTAQWVPINECHPLQAQSPYSASKIGADKLVESFYCSYSQPVVTIRPFNTYGPRQSARAVIPTIISQMVASDTIHLGNLDTRRDFTFVSDTVAGFLLGAETPGIEGQTFNLGTGSEISVGQLVESLSAIAGRQVKVVVDTDRLRPQKSEVLRLLSDNSQARQVLHWQPDVTLVEGLTKTYIWINNHLEFYHAGMYQR